jgi:hypothetical protein
MVLTAHALQAVQVRLKSVNNAGHFTLEDETAFRPVSRRIAVGSLSKTTWYFLRIGNKEWKIGCRRSEMKGTLLLRPKQFFVSISPRIAMRLLIPHGSLGMRYKQ